MGAFLCFLTLSPFNLVPRAKSPGSEVALQIKIPARTWERLACPEDIGLQNQELIINNNNNNNCNARFLLEDALLSSVKNPL